MVPSGSSVVRANVVELSAVVVVSNGVVPSGSSVVGAIVVELSGVVVVSNGVVG